MVFRANIPKKLLPYGRCGWSRTKSQQVCGSFGRLHHFQTKNSRNLKKIATKQKQLCLLKLQIKNTRVQKEGVRLAAAMLYCMAQCLALSRIFGEKIALHTAQIPNSLNYPLAEMLLFCFTTKSSLLLSLYYDECHCPVDLQRKGPYSLLSHLQGHGCPKPADC